MALGTAFGSGFESGSSAVARGLQLKQQQQQAEADDRAKKLAGIQKTIKTIFDIADKGVKGAYTADPESAPEKIQGLKQELDKQMKMSSVVLQALGQNPEPLNMQFNQIFEQESPIKEAEQKGKIEGAIEFNKAGSAKDVASYQNFDTGQVLDIPFNDPEFDQKAAQARKDNFRRIKTPTVEFQSQGKLTSSQSGKIESENIEQEKLVRQNILAAEEIVNMVSRTEFVGGTSGKVLSTLNSFNSQMKQMVGADNILKDGMIDESKVDPELSKENWSFIKKAAVSADRVEGAIIQLAYTLAKMRDPGGRLSDADVAMARKTIESGASKESIINLLRDGQRRAVQFYNTEVDVLNRRVEGANYKKLNINEILQKIPEQDDTTVDDMLRRSNLL